MGLQFYFGGSGAGKSTRVYQDIIDRSIREPELEYLILVPDQFTMETQKRLCDMHPNGGIMNIDVLSFSRLAHRIFEEVGNAEKHLLDDTGKNLILRKVAEDKVGELGVIGRNIKKTGYIHEVKSVISEFYQYNITPDALEELVEFAEGKGLLPHKLKDLEVLYRAFMEYIEGKYITTQEYLEQLKNVLHQSETIAKSVIVLDGFTGFTPVQNSLIQELMVRSQDVLVTVLADDRETCLGACQEQSLFYLSYRTVHTLEQLANEALVPQRADVELKAKPVMRYAGNPEMAFLEKNLFRYSQETYPESCHAVRITESTTLREEVQNICQTIRELIREEGYCYRDVAVITGDLGRYAHLVEDEFAHYQIPLFLDQTSGVLFHPLTEFITSALSVLIYDFSYESVFRYLRTGLVDMDREVTDRLENYVIKKGIRGKSAYEKLFVRKDPELQELNEAREILIDSLEPLLKEHKSAGEHVRNIYEFCVKNHLQEKMQNYEQKFNAQQEFARAKEYGQIYRVVMDLLDQIYHLLGEEVLTDKEFLEILKAGFSEIKVGTIPQSVDQVVVGDMERTRLKQIRSLFFLGVNDGIIPKSSEQGGLLSDMERQFLLDGGKELAPGRRQQIFIQRLYLYSNMTKPSERLYLSYSKVNAEGKTLRPSYLIGNLLQMFPKLQKEEDVSKELMTRIETRQDGLDDLAVLMREYAMGTLNKECNKEKDSEKNSEKNRRYLFQILYVAYRGSHELERIQEAAFWQYRDHSVSREVATGMYGEMMVHSVSRLEEFAKCAYAHFIKYGLELRPREEYSFQAMDMGTIFHGVLEGFGDFARQEGYSFLTLPEEMCREYVEKRVQEYATEYGETVLYSSARNMYAIERMKRILNRTIDTLQYQLRQGLFQPVKVETSFRMGNNVRIQGRIDRIDTCEQEDTVYVKVLDYKSGNVKFDPVELYYGLQMQLAVYLNAAVEIEKREHPDKKIVPAAILYYPMQDPFVDGKEEAEEQILGKIREELRTNGLVREEDSIVSMLDTAFEKRSTVIPVERKKDGGYTAASATGSQEEFGLMAEYVNYKIDEIGSSIRNGCISINPYEKGDRSACTYCDYRSVCGFDNRIPGYEKRILPGLSKEEAEEKMADHIRKQNEEKGDV